MEAVTKLPVPSEGHQTVRALRHELDNNCYGYPAKREACELALLLVENPIDADIAYVALKRIHRLALNLSCRQVVGAFFRAKFAAVTWAALLDS